MTRTGFYGESVAVATDESVMLTGIGYRTSLWRIWITLETSVDQAVWNYR